MGCSCISEVGSSKAFGEQGNGLSLQPSPSDPQEPAATEPLSTEAGDTAWQVLGWLLHVNGYAFDQPAPEECASMLRVLAAQAVSEAEFASWLRRRVTVWALRVAAERFCPDPRRVASRPLASRLGRDLLEELLEAPQADVDTRGGQSADAEAQMVAELAAGRELVSRREHDAVRRAPLLEEDRR